MAHGWVSFGVRGGSGGEGVGVLGAGVVAVVFAVEVVGPVLVEFAVGQEGAELEDGFGCGGGPAGSGDVHAVLDQVAAGAFDDAGGDGPSVGEGGGVVEAGGFDVEVAGGFFGGGALGLGQAGGGGGPGADGGGGPGGAAGQDGGGVAADPGAGVGAGFGAERPGGGPQVFQDVDEVGDDGQGDAAAGGFGLHPVDLVLVAVGQPDPGGLAARVAAVGLGEQAGDDGGGGAVDADGQPLALGLRAAGLRAAGLGAPGLGAPGLRAAG